MSTGVLDQEFLNSIRIAAQAVEREDWEIVWAQDGEITIKLAEFFSHCDPADVSTLVNRVEEAERIMRRLIAPCPNCHTNGRDYACRSTVHLLGHEAISDIRRFLGRAQA